MSTPQIGYSFSPTLENADEGRRGGSPAVRSQDPLQVLSYRLPKWKGAAGGLSPLQGTQGVGSSIGSAVLESVFRTVLGPDAAQQLFSGQMPSGFISPPGMGVQDPAVPRPAQADPGHLRVNVPGLDSGEPSRPAQAPAAPALSQPSPFRQQERDPVPTPTPSPFPFRPQAPDPVVKPVSESPDRYFDPPALATPAQPFTDRIPKLDWMQFDRM